jgi:hypothetical protein
VRRLVSACVERGLERSDVDLGHERYGIPRPGDTRFTFSVLSPSPPLRWPQSLRAHHNAARGNGARGFNDKLSYPKLCY